MARNHAHVKFVYCCTVYHLVSVHLLGAGQISQLTVAGVSDIDTVRGHIPVYVALIVQEHDCRFYASRVEAYGGLFVCRETKNEYE